MKTKELYRAQISAHVEVAILMLFIGYSLWSLTTRFRLSKDATKGEREVEFTIVCQPNRIFLSAEWRHLLMLNYVVEPDLLLPYVPPGTSLDSFCGRTYVSLVGFRFTCTRLFGFLPVPFHTNFDEVNLRLYVRRKADDEHRRGVVFIAEVVPRRAIATIARLVYGENYTSSPMRHQVAMEGPKKTTRYQWRVGGQWCKLSAQTTGAPKYPAEGSLEQFITEHYWGYSNRPGRACLEYQVAHDPWQVWASTEAEFEGDAGSLYGCELGAALQRRSDSAFVAEGSPVVVFRGNRIS
ncbi:MAG: DUF2071 domain-containing protein [Candidatus Sulfotelmatobacter sp.]